MSRPDLERNVGRYLAFSAFAFTPVMLPVLVLFWRENGLDMFEVYLLQGLFAAAIVCLEVPTGMIADRLGKRTSLIAGMSIITSGCVVYALGRSFAGFLLAEVMLALGFSLFSGAGSALLYDTLKALSREGDFTRLEGRARALQMVSAAASTLLGGWVGTHSYRLTVWLSALGPFLALLLALSLREVANGGVARAARGRRAWRDEYLQLIRDSARFVFRHRLVRWQIAYLATLMGGGMWLLWLYQPYMAWTGLPVWAFGVAYTAFNLFAASMSHIAHRVDARFGLAGTCLLLALLQVATPLAMALAAGPWGVALILGQQAVRGIAPPALSAHILRHAYADKRATVLSISSMASRLMFAATAPLIGLVADRADIAGNLLLQAGVSALLLGALLLGYRRIPAKYFAVKPAVSARQ